MRDAEKTIGARIDKANTSFISSVDEEGFPNTKSMIPVRKREGIKTFYMATKTYSLCVSHFRADPKACLSFIDRRFFRGVMLRGTTDVLEDAAANRRYDAGFKSENFQIE